MRTTAFVVGLALALVAMSAVTACAQWGGGNAGSLGISYAYSGDPDGFRVEYGTDKLVFDGLFFRDDHRDSDIYGVELGWKASDGSGGLGGNGLVVGAGYYSDDPAAGVDDSGVSWWAGLGDFGGTKKGVFYQFRYIGSGPLEGTQGVLGWRF